jgi:hypothetical protein
MIMSALHVEAQPTTKKKKKKSAFYKKTGPNVRCSGRSGVQLYLIHTTQRLTKRVFFFGRWPEIAAAICDKSKT